MSVDTGLFFYDAGIGDIRWSTSVGRKVKKGDRAGYVSRDGNGGVYRKVAYKGRRYLSHRIIYEIFNGEIPKGLVIDHINGDTLDNRIENLRGVSNSESMKNRSLYKKNKLGIAGIYRDGKKFRARIRVSGKLVTLVSTDDFFEACCARKSAERRYGFHENHCNR